MSSRTYNLRTHQETGALLRYIIPAPVSSHSHVSTELTRDAPPHLSSLVLDSDSPQALYSDVVASRPPSPRRETKAQVAPSMSSYPISGGELVQSLAPGINNNCTSSEEDEPPIVKEKFSEWMTVNCRRARSLGSAVNDSRPLERGGIVSNRELTEEQSQAVRAATTNMTSLQRDVLAFLETIVEPFPSSRNQKRLQEHGNNNNSIVLYYRMEYYNLLRSPLL